MSAKDTGGAASDLLDMGRINSLPHPIFARTGGTWWPIYDVCVETGATRLDVCGMLDFTTFSAVTRIKDADGVEYDPDDFYADAMLAARKEAQ